MAFPSTPTHGKIARIEIGASGGAATVIDYSSRWSINWVKDAAVFGRQGQECKEATPGQCSWTGTGEFIFVRSSQSTMLYDLAVSTVAAPALTTGISSSNLRFCFNSTVNRLKGSIIVTGMSLDAPVGDLIRASFTFQGSGPLVFADA